MTINEINEGAGTATLTFNAEELNFLMSAVGLSINKAKQRNRSCERLAARYATGDPAILEDVEPFPERNARHIRMNNARINKGGGVLAYITECYEKLVKNDDY